MHGNLRKKQLQKKLVAYGLIALFVLSIGLMTRSVHERFIVEREMAARRVSAEHELQTLRQRAAALESQVGYLEDERGMEAEIRNRFDVVKEGEQVVIIVDDEPDQELIEPFMPVEKDEPWYKFW